MKTTACLSLLLLLLLAGCDRASESGYGKEGSEPAPQHTVAYLKSLCDGKVSVQVTQEIVIRGFITGNDLYGEFYKTLVVEDASGGIQIAADRASLNDDYPFGIRATVRCNGLTLYNYGGKIQLGTTPDENGVGRIPGEELSRYIRTEQPDGETPCAAPLAFSEVAARHIDTRVRFDEVRFTQAARWCDTDPETGRYVTTERTIADARGREFTVRTAGTCVYAKEPLPQGKGSLYGIIDYFDGKFTLRVTNRGAVFPDSADVSAADP